MASYRSLTHKRNEVVKIRRAGGRDGGRPMLPSSRADRGRGPFKRPPVTFLGRASSSAITYKSLRENTSVALCQRETSISKFYSRPEEDLSRALSYSGIGIGRDAIVSDLIGQFRGLGGGRAAAV